MYQRKYQKRGVIMYIAEQLQTSTVDELTLRSYRPPSRGTYMVISEDSKTILIGNIYHSPNSSSENNEYLRRCIDECGRLGYKHVVIMEDFNIDWDTWNGRSEKDAKFIETIQDNFLYQHVDQPTRYRIGQNPTLDDLVMSNIEELIQDLTYLDPLVTR